MSEWPQIAIRDIATHIKDGTHGTHRRMETGVPLLSAKNISAGGRLTWDKTDDLISESDYALLTSTFAPKAKDLLLTVVGSIGRSALFEGGGIAFQRSVAFVRCNGLITPEFLYQASCAVEFTRQLERRCNVTAQAGLYLGELAKIKVPLPPKVQQERIATILSTIDTAIEQTEALIEKYQRIKTGLMHDLFTRGVLPSGQLRPPHEQAPELYQQTAIGWIPREWRVSTLSNTCQTIVDCPHSTPIFLPSGVLVARTMHIKNGVFLENEASRVSEEEYQERVSRAEPMPGDVILTREAPVGEAFVIPVGMKICLGQRVMLIKPSSSLLDSDYLVAQIYSGALSTRIAELTAGTTNPHLNVADVRSLLLALPPYEEQQEQKLRIQAMNSKIHMQEDIATKLKLQKLGLMQDLLTGKVAVKVDSPDNVATHA